MMTGVRLGVGLVTVLVLVASPAAAQTTRTEAITAQQAEKAKTLGIEGPNDAEVVVRRVMLSPLLGGGDGVYPWFGSVYDGTGMAFGVGYIQRLQKAALVSLQSGLSVNSSMMLRAQVAAPELWRGKLRLDGTAQWVDARNVSFYGFGPDSDVDARSRYNYSPFDIGGTVTARPQRLVFMTAGYTYHNLDSHLQSGPLTPEDMPGVGEDLLLHSRRVTIGVDWRSSPAYSTRGGLYRASFGRTTEGVGRPYSFTAREAEIVQLVPLVREQYVLAIRGLISETTPDAGHDVPIMFAPFLGSGSTLRGYKNRRFTDYSRALVSAEYRWRPSRYLDMALFVDSGQVAREARELKTSRFNTVWGIGARFHGPTFNALRIEVSRGREGFHWTFSGSQPF
jgi:hypothetical protein